MLSRARHLRLGRELLADAAHRLCRRSARDLAAIDENDVAGRPARRGGTRRRRLSPPRRLRRYEPLGDRVSEPPASSRSVNVRSGARTSSRTGTSLSEHDLQRGDERESLQRVAQERDALGRLVRSARRRAKRRPRGTPSRAGRRRPPRARAPWPASGSTDEDVETFDEVRLDAVEGGVGDLQAGEVRNLFAQPLHDRQGNGVAAARRDLVQEERCRRARVGDGREVTRELRFVEGVVRRSTAATASTPRPPRARRARRSRPSSARRSERRGRAVLRRPRRKSSAAPSPPRPSGAGPFPGRSRARRSRRARSRRRSPQGKARQAAERRTPVAQGRGGRGEERLQHV